MIGWIKLHRKFMEWGWYQNSNMVHLFIHLLLTANRKPGNVLGTDLERGQAIVGRKKLSEQTGISEQTLRTCITRLKSTKEITTKSTNKYTIVTICNYDVYNPPEPNTNQEINQDSNQQLTSNQPATNHKQEVKKKEVKKKNPPKSPQGDSGNFEIPENLNSPKFKKVWEDEWIAYRREQKFSAYKPIGLKAALSGLDKMSGGDTSVAIKIIRQSIEKNWQGLFELKSNGQSRKPGVSHGAKKSRYDRQKPVTKISVKDENN